MNRSISLLPEHEGLRRDRFGLADLLVILFDSLLLVPLLGFLSISGTGFIALFSGRRLPS